MKTKKQRAVMWSELERANGRIDAAFERAKHESDRELVLAIRGLSCVLEGMLLDYGPRPEPFPLSNVESVEAFGVPDASGVPLP